MFWREKGVTRGLLLPRLVTHIAQERPKDCGGRARQDEEQQDELDVRVASEALRCIAPQDANLHERDQQQQSGDDRRAEDRDKEASLEAPQRVIRARQAKRRERVQVCYLEQDEIDGTQRRGQQLVQEDGHVREDLSKRPHNA